MCIRDSKLAIAKIEDLISYRLKNEKLVKLKKTDKIVIKNKKYQIKIFENQLDGSEHFALIKGKISPSKILEYELYLLIWLKVIY